MIQKILVISTAHVSETTAEWLTRVGEIDAAPTPIALTTYGWIVGVPTMEDSWAAVKELAPQDLLEVLRYAETQGCAYLHLDRDADKLPDLPVYDW